MRNSRFWVRSILCAASFPVVASAQTVVFSENFDGGTGANRFDMFLSGNGGDGTFDANYNYGAFNYKLFPNPNDANTFTSQPIPPAPGGTSTTGMRVSVNDLSASGLQASLALLPKDPGTGRPMVGDNFKIDFDVWMNYAGPAGGADGSTEFFSAGINKDGTGIAGRSFPSSSRANGYTFAVDGEAGTTGDYRGYNKESGDDGPSYAGLNQTWTGEVENTIDPTDGTQVTTNPDEGATDYHKSIFPLPSYETEGAPGKHWVHASIQEHGNVVDFYLNGNHINTLYLLSGPATGVPSFGYFDPINGAVATDDQDEFVLYDNIVVTQLGATSKYNGTNGSFSDSSKWSNGVPGGADQDAVFDSAAAPATVNITAPVSLRGLVFTSANSYTIGAGTSSTITLSAVSSAIATYAGSHVINAPVTATGHVSVYTAPGTSLTINKLSTDQTKFFAKTGEGTLAVNKIRAAGMTVTGGVLQLLPNGGNSRTTALDLGNSDEPGVLDLSPGTAMIIDYTLQVGSGSPPATNSPFLGIYGKTLLGYNGGNWAPTLGTQPYILSSAAAAVAADGSNPHKTGVGYAEASTILGPTGGMFNGEAVDGDAVLVKYTLLGDANLDGKVNALDFNILATNFGSGNFPGWTEGDTNYDASVDTNDFTMLALNFGQALPSSALATLVPEPSLCLALIAAIPALRRRRGNHMH